MPRRRRRVSPLRRWLPTILVVGVVAGFGLLLVGRQVTASRDTTPTQPIAAPVVATDPPAPAVQSSPGSPPAEQAPARRIRSTVAAVEPTYTVTGGDTLSAIAQRYNTTVDALVAINNLPDRSVTLRVGQRLILP